MDGQAVLTALSMAKTGKIYDLGQELFEGMPRWPTHPPFMLGLLRVHKLRKDGRSGAACTFSLGGHTGTHLDALGHTGVNGYVYGHKESVLDHQSWTSGLGIGGIQETPPIVTPGVMLDVARLRGSDILPEDYEITGDDLEQCVKRQEITVPAGATILVRTGWMRYWPDPFKYGSPEFVPGLGDSACVWIVEQRARYAGADTEAFGKVVKGAGTGRSHAILQNEQGIQILEALTLEELSADRVSLFTFVCLPLKIRGGTASPVRPIAIA